MRLAEALQERADLNRKIDQLESRLSNNALIQEGEKADEDPKELLKELDESVSRLEILIAEINLTNCATQVDGKSLTEIIARKDTLTKKVSVYRTLISAAGYKTMRARGSEIKIVSSVNVAQLQKKADEIAKEIRLLDNTLQEYNWKTELIEK